MNDKEAFAFAIKKEVTWLKRQLGSLKDLGLEKESKDLKENIKTFIDSKELDAAKLKESATKIFEKAKEAYTTALKK